MTSEKNASILNMLSSAESLELLGYNDQAVCFYSDALKAIRTNGDDSPDTKALLAYVLSRYAAVDCPQFDSLDADSPHWVTLQDGSTCDPDPSPLAAWWESRATLQDHESRKRLEFGSGLANEAISIYEEMVERDAATYLPRLAFVLRIRARYSSHLWEHHYSAFHIKEAVDAYSQLYEAFPEIYAPLYAESLKRYGFFLYWPEDLDEFDCCFQKAIRLYSRLTKGSPLPYADEALFALEEYIGLRKRLEEYIHGIEKWNQNDDIELLAIEVLKVTENAAWSLASQSKPIEAKSIAMHRAKVLVSMRNGFESEEDWPLGAHGITHSVYAIWNDSLSYRDRIDDKRASEIIDTEITRAKEKNSFGREAIAAELELTSAREFAKQWNWLVENYSDSAVTKNSN